MAKRESKVAKFFESVPKMVAKSPKFSKLASLKILTIFGQNGVAKKKKNGTVLKKFGKSFCVTCHTDGAAETLKNFPK